MPRGVFLVDCGPSINHVRRLRFLAIVETLGQVGWVVSGPRGAAAKLGLKRTTLLAKMKGLGISRPIPEEGTSVSGIAQRRRPDLRVELAAAHGIELEVSKLEQLERQTVIDPIPELFVYVLPDGPLEFGSGSWLASRKSTGSFKVLQTPHGWRLLRVIACMPTQPWKASPGSIQIRPTKLTGAVSFWKRTEPSPLPLGKDLLQLELRIACRSAVNFSIDSVS